MMRIAAGALLAALGIWFVTAFFMDTIMEKAYDADLGAKVFRPGLVAEHRTEGWGVTRYGQHGLAGIPDIDAVGGERVMIWGDSHVEALQVNDADKTAMQVTQLWQGTHPDSPLTAVSVGESGVHFAQHYFDIPRYERVVRNVRKHYLVVSLPDRGLATRAPYKPSLYSQYVCDGGAYGLKERAPDNNPLKSLFPLLNRLHLRVVYYVIGKLHQGSFAMTFKLGPRRGRSAAKGAAAPDGASQLADYTWLLGEIKKQTSAPLTVIYTPCTPLISKGKVSFESAPADTLSAGCLKAACEKNGVGFIHLGDAFRKTYESTGVFCRGFVNTQPGGGHFNPLGHRVLAEAIVADLEAGAK